MRTSSWLAIAVLLVLLLAWGCKKPPQSGTPSGGTGAGQTAAVQDEYRFPLPADPMTLDPAHITDSVSDAVSRRIFSQLVRFAPDCSVVDDLALSHEISPDGLTYTFKLRQGVKFHNGDPLTADDVVYSLKRMLDPAVKSERANLLYYVRGARPFHEGKTPDLPGIVALDPVTVQIALEAPYAPFLDVLCVSVFGVVPKKAVEADPQGFGDKPVGSGPFTFVSWAKGDRIVLRANKDYYKTPPSYANLVFRIITDEKTRFENFKTKMLEHCDLAPSQIAEVNANPELKALVKGQAAMDMYSYGFNCEQAPFKDNTALRQALNYAVDKENIVKNIWGGMVTEQKTYVPEGTFYYWQDAPGYPYDPKQAAELLEKAGYPGGKGLPELVLNIDLQPTNKLVAQAVQEDLRKAGVNVRIETTTWGPFLEKVYDGQALFFQNTWIADYPDPDNWLYQLLDSENFGEKGNIARWSSPEFDKLVLEAQTTQDEAARAELYKQAEKIAYDEAPWLLLFWKNSSTLVQPYIEGLEITRMDRSPQLNNAPFESVKFVRN